MSELVATSQQGLVGKYQPYQEYKDSGVEWLGNVPSHWTVTAVKRFASFTTGWTPPTGNDAYFGGEHLWANISDIGHRVLSTTAKTITDAGVRATRIKKSPKGSLLFSFKLSIGLVSIVGEDMYTNEAIATFLPSETFNISYMYWAAPLFIPQNAEENIYGAKLLNQERISNASFVLPTPKEQRAIAAFLDYETARIDLLITQQQRLIELLKEKRQAVISHAVTKGLNPDAPMKDSGIEWLGQVPKHWVVSPLKYKCEFSGGGTPSKDNLEYWNGSIPWVSPKDMKSFWITDAEDKITEQAIKESSTKLVQPGAVLMVVRSGILQRTIPVGINTIPVTMNQDMKAIRFSSAVYAEWLSFFIKGYEDSLLLDWRKQGATVESIEHEYLANSLMLFPPEEEARSIIAALGRRLDKFDQLEQRASDAITLLQERRTALISAAVTGKIDLRGWTPSAEEAAA